MAGEDQPGFDAQHIERGKTHRRGAGLGKCLP